MPLVRRNALLVFAGAALGCSTASEARDVEVNLVPFIGAPQIDGRLQQGPLAVDLDLGPGDIANGVKAGFRGYADASTDDVVVSGQIIFADFQQDSFAPSFGARTDAQAFSVEAMAGRNYMLAICRSCHWLAPVITGSKARSIATRWQA